MSENNAIPFPQPEQRVTVLDDHIRLVDFTETDPIVVEILSKAANPDADTHTLLQVGARAVRIADAAADADLVERKFASLSKQFEATLDKTLSTVTEASESLFGDDGNVAKILATFKQSFEDSLDSSFDPDSKKSIIAKVELAVAEMAKAQRQEFQRLTDPTDDASPLHKMKRDTEEQIREAAKSLTNEIHELSKKIAVNDKEAEVFELTTLKGVAFEDLVHDHVTALAARHGDIAEQTGHEAGIAGTKKGDEVVTLNSEDVIGDVARFVLEIKDRKLSQKQVTAELDASMENREGLAGVLVFATQAQAPTSVPFSYSGQHAIVVVEKDEYDPWTIKLAYMWARWVTRRESSPTSIDEVDFDRIEALIDRIATAMGRCSTIKSGHSSARKGLAQADSHLKEMQAEIADALESLRTELQA